MPKDGADGLVQCPVCRKRKPAREMIPGTVLNDLVLDAIHDGNTEWSEEDDLCSSCLARAINGLQNGDGPADDPISDDPSRVLLQKRTFSEFVSDIVASFVGSWAFLLSQVGFLALWIMFNSIVIFRYRFDPYPFIFLNLVLSWVAALQAPLVLMSQNRQDTRDRLRDENEYRTNLTAEREIRQLHVQINQLVTEFIPAVLAIHEQQEHLVDEMSRLLHPGEKRDEDE
ncbi:MAG TPA: DUF1003 domain-containing protein [Armatimonadota bacterium]|nr:DUF1003 domain-containing protein [Armatimonadota bacterium]